MLVRFADVMGTLDYIAPEQTGHSQDVDIRADIYSLGATLYRLLCGRTPYGDEKYDTPVRKLNALANEPVPPILQLRPDLPDELASVVEKMLAKSAEDRYATPADVATALAPMAADADLLGLLDRLPANSDDQTPIDASMAPTDVFLSSAMTGTHASGALPRSASLLEPTVDSTPVVKAVDADGGWFNNGRHRTFLAAGAFGAILFAAFMIIRLATDKGEITIAAYDPSIEVLIKRNGKVVDDFKVEQKKGATSYYSGPYEIEIKGGKPDGVTIENETFELTRGKDVLVKITRGKLSVLRTATAGNAWKLGPAEDEGTGKVVLRIRTGAGHSNHIGWTPITNGSPSAQEKTFVCSALTAHQVQNLNSREAVTIRCRGTPTQLKWRQAAVRVFMSGT